MLINCSQPAGWLQWSLSKVCFPICCSGVEIKQRKVAENKALSLMRPHMAFDEIFTSVIRRFTFNACFRDFLVTFLQCDVTPAMYSIKLFTLNHLTFYWGNTSEESGWCCLDTISSHCNDFGFCYFRFLYVIVRWYSSNDLCTCTYVLQYGYYMGLQVHSIPKCISFYVYIHMYIKGNIYIFPFIYIFPPTPPFCGGLL